MGVSEDCKVSQSVWSATNQSTLSLFIFGFHCSHHIFLHFCSTPPSSDAMYFAQNNRYANSNIQMASGPNASTHYQAQPKYTRMNNHWGGNWNNARSFPSGPSEATEKIFWDQPESFFLIDHPEIVGEFASQRSYMRLVCVFWLKIREFVLVLLER